ncbi:MAG: cupin domain-containing protein [Pseudomonadota bacterium]
MELVTTIAALLVAGSAYAQEAEPTRVVEGFEGPAQPKNISFDAIGSLALNGRVPGLDARVLRSRVWTIEPGGVVPIHSHTNRPAFVYVLSGSLVEFRNTIPDGKRTNAGDLSAEGLGIVHYWRNDGKVPAILFAVDLFEDSKLKDLTPKSNVSSSEATPGERM